MTRCGPAPSRCGRCCAASRGGVRKSQRPGPGRDLRPDGRRRAARGAAAGRGLPSGAPAGRHGVPFAAGGGFRRGLRGVSRDGPLRAGRGPGLLQRRGRALPGDPEAMRRLLAAQLARPVRFVEQVEAMYASGARTFVELGPGAVLTGLVGKILAGRPHRAISLDARGHRCRHGLSPGARAAVRGGARAGPGAALGSVPAAAGPAGEAPARRRDRHLRDEHGKPYPPPAGRRRCRRRTPRLAVRPRASAAAPRLRASRGPGSRRIANCSARPPRRTRRGRRRRPGRTSRSWSPWSAPAPRWRRRRVAGGGFRPFRGRSCAPVTAGDCLRYAPERRRPRPGRRRQRPAAAAAAGRRRSAIRGHRRILAALLAVVAEKTGYPVDLLRPEMALEADLGIDSVKRVEILAALEERLPALAQLEPAALAGMRTLGDIVARLEAPAARPAAPVARRRGGRCRRAPARCGAGALPGGVDLAALLLAVVAEKTGYPAELLTPEMGLEADLGIDSIKRIEILSALEERLPGTREVDPAAVAALRTLGDVLEHLRRDRRRPASAAGRRRARPGAPARRRSRGDGHRWAVRGGVVPTPAPGLGLAGLAACSAIHIVGDGAASPRALAARLGSPRPLVDEPPPDAEAVIVLAGLGGDGAADAAGRRRAAGLPRRARRGRRVHAARRRVRHGAGHRRRLRPLRRRARLAGRDRRHREDRGAGVAPRVGEGHRPGAGRPPAAALADAIAAELLEGGGELEVGLPPRGARHARDVPRAATRRRRLGPRRAPRGPGAGRRARGHRGVRDRAGAPHPRPFHPARVDAAARGAARARRAAGRGLPDAGAGRGRPHARGGAGAGAARRAGARDPRGARGARHAGGAARGRRRRPLRGGRHPRRRGAGAGAGRRARGLRPDHRAGPRRRPDRRQADRRQDRRAVRPGVRHQGRRAAGAARRHGRRPAAADRALRLGGGAPRQPGAVRLRRRQRDARRRGGAGGPAARRRLRRARAGLGPLGRRDGHARAAGALSGARRRPDPARRRGRAVRRGGAARRAGFREMLVEAAGRRRAGGEPAARPRGGGDRRLAPLPRRPRHRERPGAARGDGARVVRARRARRAAGAGADGLPRRARDEGRAPRPLRQRRRPLHRGLPRGRRTGGWRWSCAAPTARCTTPPPRSSPERCPTAPPLAPGRPAAVPARDLRRRALPRPAVPGDPRRRRGLAGGRGRAARRRARARLARVLGHRRGGPRRRAAAGAALERPRHRRALAADRRRGLSRLSRALGRGRAALHAARHGAGRRPGRLRHLLRDAGGRLVAELRRVELHRRPEMLARPPAP